MQVCSSRGVLVEPQRSRRAAAFSSRWGAISPLGARRTRLVNLVGAAAERENHHPDLAISGWNKVTFRLSTHDAGGLTGNDFVLAREIDVLIAVGGVAQA